MYDNNVSICSGINVRYLGTVTSLVEKQPALGYLQVCYLDWLRWQCGLVLISLACGLWAGKPFDVLKCFDTVGWII